MKIQDTFLELGQQLIHFSGIHTFIWNSFLFQLMLKVSHNISAAALDWMSTKISMQLKSKYQISGGYRRHSAVHFCSQHWPILLVFALYSIHLISINKFPKPNYLLQLSANRKTTSPRQKRKKEWLGGANVSNIQLHLTGVHQASKFPNWIYS